MGVYLQTKRMQAKAEEILATFPSARVVSPPATLSPPAGDVYVCVVENAFHDAALVVSDETEFRRVHANQHDHRPRTWLTIAERELVAALRSQGVTDEDFLFCSLDPKADA